MYALDANIERQSGSSVTYSSMQSESAPSHSTIAPDATPAQQDDFSEHDYAIEALAQESNWPVPVVADMYLDQLSRLERDAKVTTFLGVLTTRKVRDALRRLPARTASAVAVPA